MARPNRSDQRTHSTAEIAHSTLHSPTPNPSNRDAMHGCQLQRGTPHQTTAESRGSTRPAPDLADRAQENPPSNARATETDGSNRISEHSPKKLKKYRITRAPPVPRTRSTTRSSTTARRINFSRKRDGRIGNPNLLARVGGGGLSSAAGRCCRGTPDCCWGGVDKEAQLRGRSVFYSGTRPRGCGQRANGAAPRLRRGAHADTPRARRGERRLRLACGPGQAVGPKHQWDGLPWVAGSEYVVGGEYPPARLRTSPPGSANW